MAYTPARKERNEGEVPLRAENKEIAPRNIARTCSSWSRWEGDNPKTPMTAGRGKPKDPDNRVRNQPCIPNLKHLSGNS